MNIGYNLMHGDICSLKFWLKLRRLMCVRRKQLCTVRMCNKYIHTCVSIYRYVCMFVRVVYKKRCYAHLFESSS